MHNFGIINKVAYVTVFFVSTCTRIENSRYSNYWPESRYRWKFLWVIFTDSFFGACDTEWFLKSVVILGKKFYCTQYCLISLHQEHELATTMELLGEKEKMLVQESLFLGQIRNWPKLEVVSTTLWNLSSS